MLLAIAAMVFVAAMVGANKVGAENTRPDDRTTGHSVQLDIATACSVVRGQTMVCQ